jgi:hypothetical protein
MKKQLTIIYLLCLFTIAACKKEFDVPPLKTAAESGTITITQMKKRLLAPVDHYYFAGGDTNLYCLVTSDETSGNFYRQVHVRDEEGGAIQVRLISDGGLFTGDRIRINLNTVYLVIANNMIYLDSVDVEKAVVKLSSGNEVLPKVTTIGNILANSGFPLEESNFQSQLVELNGVEFDAIVRGKTFADAVSKTSSEYLLRDCAGKSISIRTSGRSNFASKIIPSANGKLIAIVSQYDSEMQLSIRNFADVKMVNAACTSVPSGTVANTATFVLAAAVNTLNESFNAAGQNITFEQAGWINYNETGNNKWKGNIKSGNYKSLKATSYGTSEKNVMWLISPPVVYANTLKLSFKTAMEFYSNGHTEPLMAFISTDYNGSNFSTANWSKIESASYASASDVNYTGPLGLKSSGEILLKTISPLQSYQGTFVIGFRYSGDAAHTSNFYLDDVMVH